MGLWLHFQIFSSDSTHVCNLLWLYWLIIWISHPKRSNFLTFKLQKFFGSDLVQQNGSKIQQLSSKNYHGFDKVSDKRPKSSISSHKIIWVWLSSKNSYQIYKKNLDFHKSDQIQNYHGSNSSLWNRLRKNPKLFHLTNP